VSDEPLELALRALGRKERSTVEMTRWLTERGVSDDDVAATVDRLAEVGELDDARFARRYAEDKRELAGWGAERIREALIARGVEPEDIEGAMAADEEPDQVERATGLLVRRASRVDSERGRARALGYLTRKGYTYEVAHEAIRAYERTEC
jgi:regulatory protein